MNISDAFDDEAVAVLASTQSIQRGMDYARKGRVNIGKASDAAVEATVSGTLSYRVALSAVDNSRRWRCSCPVGVNGEFCKHCVAVAAVMNAADDLGESTAEIKDAVAQPSPEDELRNYLSGLEPDDLIDLIVESAKKDGRLRTRLLREAELSRASAGSSGEADSSALDVKALKREITAAFGRGYVSYREAAGWAEVVNDAIDWISDICDAGHFETAAVLAEHAHKRTETAAQRVDDSAGWITDIFHRIADIHAAACNEGAFGPKPLARRLVKLELNAELDTFHRSAISHAEGLGPEGLKLYGELVKEAFDALPADASAYGASFRIRHARRAHAIATNDPDLLVEVMSDDIRSPLDHLEIIDAYIAAGHPDEALAWADESLKVFADRTHQLDEVRARRADLLRATGDNEAVTAMYRASFQQTPTPQSYQLFIDSAVDPEALRQEAIDFVLARLPEKGEGSGVDIDIDVDGEPEPAEMIGRSVSDRAAYGTVSVLLAAEEDEQAWAVALAHGAQSYEWHQMAERRQLDDPDSAIAVFAIEAEAAIDKKNRGGYLTAASLLERIERVATATGRPELSAEILDDIKQRHYRKTSLMEILG